MDVTMLTLQPKAGLLEPRWRAMALGPASMACLLRPLGHSDVSCQPSCQACLLAQIPHTFLLSDVTTLRHVTPSANSWGASRKSCPLPPTGSPSHVAPPTSHTVV